ncbi:MAG TPA: ATP-binding protein [Vicinamibacterales bacterium]|nr:ATP-binding protein [Vicinamibacterales bacterium]
MDSPTLLERLAAHRTLGAVPREQLEWLVEHGHEYTLEPGGILTPSTGPVMGLHVVLSGHLLIRVDSGAGPRIVMEWHGGDVTGVLPYSRIRKPPGSVVAEERSSILTVDTPELPRLIRECPDLTEVLVHVMLDRARVFKSSELLDEKMSSLGRLAAGLAHELNNPASAVSRSAKMLLDKVTDLEAATRRFCSLKLSDGQCEVISMLRQAHAPDRPRLSPLDLSDRTDQLETWLETHQVESFDPAPLAEAGFATADLDQLNDAVGAANVTPVLAQLSASLSVRQLVNEIDTASSRIHTLVAAVKGFTYVNQQATLQPIAIGRGLADTITVLRSKARTKQVEIDVQVPDDLPPVEGYGGELNQVWANLVDNAIDATPGGHVRLEASAADGRVMVKVIDDGTGIPPEVLSRIFDPFFTTKEIGHGTGLGLDIARRIVHRHRGALDVHSGPGRTEFCVTLPISK